MNGIKKIAEYDIYGPSFMVSALNPLPKSKLIAYMKSFAPVWRSASPVYDPVKREWVDIQRDAYTDGTWGWDSTDIYLFDTYNLALDKRFVEAHS